MAAGLRDLWEALGEGGLTVHSLAVGLLRRGAPPAEPELRGLQALGEAPLREELAGLYRGDARERRGRLLPYCGLLFAAVRDYAPLGLAVDISGQRLLAWAPGDGLAVAAVVEAGASLRQLLSEFSSRLPRLGAGGPE